MQPLISCLCPTKNPPKTVKVAIDCFNNQTYPNKELILVTDEKNAYIEDLKKLTSDNIKLFYAPYESTIGTLRNISVDNAKGEYIATWDDDDVYHKDRLTVQYNAIVRLNKECCFLKRVLVHDIVSGNKGISKTGRSIENTMVALKKATPRYEESKKIAEDVPIKNFFLSKGKCVIIDEPQLYIYNIHENNTCKYEHLIDVIDVII